jgi:hypothetical protein
MKNVSSICCTYSKYSYLRLANSTDHETKTTPLQLVTTGGSEVITARPASTFLQPKA